MFLKSINVYVNVCTQDAPLPRALNDSGCPLGDTDLFDTGLDNEEEEEDESLDSIRAAVKQKMNKHKVQKIHNGNINLCFKSFHSF